MNLLPVDLYPGRYVVAVSGGVDSVVLLHLLRNHPEHRLTVAHFDHGIRPESADDERFVRDLAQIYRMPYVFKRASLGPEASEAQAREARYDFLQAIRAAAGADAVLTAHHQDDVLETAIHNIIRGTGRRGLTSLKSTDIIKRPLLGIPKADILEYALRNNLQWREDSTNAQDIYTRNYIRHHLLPRLGSQGREKLLNLIHDASLRNAEIDESILHNLEQLSENNKIKRVPFIMLTHAVAREVMAAWLRQNGLPNIDSKMLERLVRAGKTFKPTKLVHAGSHWGMEVGKDFLALVQIER
jgi:tRNA(Ile)-lysidine synthase